MAITIKNLAEALAELFGIDETEVLARLVERDISSYGHFLRYLNEIRKQDRIWKN